MGNFQWVPIGVSGRAPLPHVQDVGATKANREPSGQDPYVYWVGSAGTLWRTVGSVTVQQVASPGDLVRVAVSPDRSVWCVDRYGRAWGARGDFNWSQIPMPGETAVDVDVAADGSVWWVTKNTRYYVQRNDEAAPRYVAVMLSIQAITGIEQPIFSDGSPNLAGKAWGVSDAVGDGGLVFSDGNWQPRDATISGVADLSTAPSNLWMVKKDGTVWTTTDGRTQQRISDLFFRRIAGDYADRAFAVAPDGSAWVWVEATTHPPVINPPVSKGAP